MSQPGVGWTLIRCGQCPYKREKRGYRQGPQGELCVKIQGKLTQAANYQKFEAGGGGGEHILPESLQRGLLSDP